MLIIWYADFDGSDEELEKVNKIFKEITDKMGEVSKDHTTLRLRHYCISSISRTMIG